MSLTLIHDGLAGAALLFSAVAALWGLVRAVRKQGMDGSTWGILATGELLLLAQGAVGIALWLGGARPERGIHVLYGVVMGLTLPAYYAISRGRDDNRAAWAYAILWVFLAGIALRARTTGG